MKRSRHQVLNNQISLHLPLKERWIQPDDKPALVKKRKDEKKVELENDKRQLAREEKNAQKKAIEAKEQKAQKLAARKRERSTSYFSQSEYSLQGSRRSEWDKDDEIMMRKMLPLL